MKKVTNIDIGTDKVWVNVERSVNLGNYENIKLSAGVSQTLIPGANHVDEARQLLHKYFDLIEALAGKQA